MVQVVISAISELGELDDDSLEVFNRVTGPLPEEFMRAELVQEQLKLAGGTSMARSCQIYTVILRVDNCENQMQIVTRLRVQSVGGSLNSGAVTA